MVLTSMSTKMINSGMKLREIFGPKDPYYAMDDSELESELNPEAASYREDEEKSAKKHYAKRGTNIVTQDEDNGEEDWSTEPNEEDWQSPGFRGQQEAKERAGMPHKKYQKYYPDYMAQENPNNLGSDYP